MNKPALLPALLTAAIMVGGFFASTMAQVVVPQSVTEAFQRSSANEYVEVLLSFEGDLDAAALKSGVYGRVQNRSERYQRVMGQLAIGRRNLEENLTPRLEVMKAAGRIHAYKFFTVSRTVLVNTRVDNLDSLMQLPGVRLINLNSAVSLINPVDEQTPALSASGSSNAGLDVLKVRSLWGRGLTGAGALICSFDTGIDGDHPALAAQWRGNHGASAAASWYAPHGGTTPDDKLGHGSHVMGIMVGSTGADTLGVAPNAQWISAAVIDQGVSFSTTIADILGAFDWALNPDANATTTDDVPDVICNSWGVPKGIYGDCENTFWNAIDNVEAAGIVTIFAAGNEGPTAQTMRNPADRASSPTNALSVGAIDPATLVVADFSSRGPSTCDANAVKPELVAPGVSIYSSYKDGGYKIMSGTSMAAPFIAGLVALMRQYNPEATVEEIKQALFNAAVDLGPLGEDNSYGLGLVDASRLLDFLPPPSATNVELYDYQITSGGDTCADPGEVAALTLTLADPADRLDSLSVWLTCSSSVVAIIPETLTFHFGAGTLYAVGTEPFHVAVAAEAVCGRPVEMWIHYRTSMTVPGDSTPFTLLIGHALPGQILPLESGGVRFSVTDFGQFGLGMNSIYQAGGEGFCFRNSANLLYEGGVIVGRNGQMVSDGVRDQDGSFRESDFAPLVTVSSAMSLGAIQSMMTGYSDRKAMLPLPVEITQTVYQNGGDFVIVACNVYNPSPAWLDGLGWGIFFDFDIDRFSDQVGVDSMIGMIYQYHEASGLYIGVLGVSSDEYALTAVQNATAGKSGFSKTEKYNLVNGSGISLDGDGAGDWSMVISRTAGQVEAFGRRTMAVAIVAGESLNELQSAALAALSMYGAVLGTDDNPAALPTMVSLSQNFPNPFNPSTTIRFAVPAAGRVTLNIFNICGQKVRTLIDGTAPAGENSVVWDGTDDSGQTAASGIYFYRLTTSETSLSRTMVLLK